jgi:NADH:ubiquinone oxidoreductase subunit 6 (subunit J)
LRAAQIKNEKISFVATNDCVVALAQRERLQDNQQEQIMATTITINVTNNSPTVQNFFFFQQPAVYSGGAQVYTNSLYTQTLLPFATSGAVLTFTMVLQYYAGVQQQVSPPQVGIPSGQLAAI